MNSATERVVILVDMDCFYCQVEEKLNPELKGKPVAVVQYNAWKGGGLIAVNYEAKAQGVSRHMRGDEAKEACPDIQLVSVPTVREKADLTRYRDAGKEVAAVLQTFTKLLERASVDEAYLDITDAVNSRLGTFHTITSNDLNNSHIVGFESVDEFLNEIKYDEHMHESDIKLAIGGVIAEEIRMAVYESTGYRCSAGIAHNKILAKLTCGLHKPNQQTVLPHESIPTLYENLSIKKIKSLGGKFGELIVQKLNIQTMKQLSEFSEKELLNSFEEKTAKWLYNIAHGIDLEPVTVRLVAKSIGCCKKFPGRGALTTEEAVRKWMNDLSTEIAERIEKDIIENNRKPKQIVVNYTQKVGRSDIASSRSQPLNSIEQQKIYQETYETVRKNCQKSDGSFCIKFLGLNVTKFEDKKQVNEITSLFANIKNRNGNTTTAVVESPSTSKQETNQLESDDSASELESIYNASMSSNAVIENKPTDDNLKNSFFYNFLKNVEPPKRDFNTSMILDELSNDSSEHNDTVETIRETIDNSNANTRVVNTDDDKQICNECNKYISLENIASHMDYHFAIKIVREEAHLYNPKRPESLTNKNSVANHKSTSKTSKKRKITNNQVQSIHSYFNINLDSEHLDDNNSQLCEECCKRIKLSELLDHMDYHLAKKVHREINSLAKENNKVPHRNPSNTSDITTYFKKS